MPRRVPVGAEASDEERRGTGCLPERLRVDGRVVGEHRRHGDAEEGAEPEEQADRKLLGLLIATLSPKMQANAPTKATMPQPREIRGRDRHRVRQPHT